MKPSKLTQLLFALMGIVLLHLASTTSFNGRNNNTSCGGCHGPGNSGAMTLTGLPTTAVPNTTYSGQICINDPVNPAGTGGFRLHISQGTYANLGAGVRTGGSGGNLGLTHDMPKMTVGGMVCWTFDWTAPASGNSNLQLYGNAANGDGVNNSADQGGYQLFEIIATADPCAADLVIIDNPIPSNIYMASNSITANTALASNANVIFDVANCVDLQADFEVPLGAEFEATTGVGQGCLDSPTTTNVFYNKKEQSE